MEELRELPKGWLWVSVGSVYSIIGGGTPSTSNPEYWLGEIPWITSADIYGLKDIRPRRFINNKAIGNSTTNLVPEGSLIIVTRVGLGKMAIANKPLCFSQDLQALTGNNSNIYPKYAMYCLSQVIQIFKYKNRGTTIAGVTKKQLSNLVFPLPPLPEQYRIVVKIEELLTNLDSGLESLQKIKAQLKRYRQAVLKHAFEGKLTEEWREANRERLEPPSVLLERIEEERKKAAKGRYKEPFRAKHTNYLINLPKEWSVVTADQCTSIITDGEHITPERSENGIPLLSARNVRDGFLSLNKVDYISEKTYDKLSKRLQIECDDVLLSCSGTVGRSCVVPKNLKFALVRSVAVLKPLLGMGDYLSYALRAPQLQLQINEKKTQTAQSNIFQGKIKSLIIPISSLIEQKKIVKEIEHCFSIADEIEKLIEQNLKLSHRLLQSILKKAFEGKLVPQDPDDEPVEKLLERNKDEREIKNQSKRR